MKETIEAIYENGVFRPLKRPAILDGLKVRIEVETASELKAEDLIELAAQVYDGLSNDQVDEIEQIALDRRHFFRHKA